MFGGRGFGIGVVVSCCVVLLFFRRHDECWNVSIVPVVTVESTPGMCLASVPIRWVSHNGESQCRTMDAELVRPSRVRLQQQSSDRQLRGSIHVSLHDSKGCDAGFGPFVDEAGWATRFELFEGTGSVGFGLWR